MYVERSGIYPSTTMIRLRKIVTELLQDNNLLDCGGLLILNC